MNIAVLIDAENVLPVYADQLMSHAASLGTVTHREIFGAAQALNTWVEPVLKYAIHPNLTIRPTKYKNSSDIALVIGAMDLVGQVDAVVIASSDSDFSSLSVRLRTAGIEVIGMGTEKANPLWRTACSSFVTLTTPAAHTSAAPKQPAQPAQQTKTQPQQSKPQQPAQTKQQANPPQQAQAAHTPAPKVANTHNGRMAIIRAFIQERLAENEGRVQSSALFSALNGLPEYRVDQQRSRRKPLNYLLRQFGDILRVEEEAGATWFVPAAQAQETASTAEKAGAAAPVAEKPSTEMKTEEKAAPQAVTQETEPPMAVAPASEPAQPEPVPALPEEVQPLMQHGLSEEVARQITAIFTSSKNLRAAYNRLRSSFGNQTGVEYYHLVKGLAEGQAEPAE